MNLLVKICLIYLEISSLDCIDVGLSPDKNFSWTKGVITRAAINLLAQSTESAGVLFLFFCFFLPEQHTSKIWIASF